MSKIIVVGSLIVDITAYSSHFPVEGETVLGHTLRMGPGGKGNNQATAAARSGATVVMVSKWGKDFLCQILKEHYEHEKMTTRYIYESASEETGSAVIEVDDGGQNRIIVVKGANDALTEEEVLAAEAEVASGDLVLCQLETSIESVETAKALAAKYHKIFMLNPAPFQQVPPELLKGVDYLTPNETEAEFFSGVRVTDEESASRAAEKLMELGVRNVIITLGKRGAYYRTGSKSGMVGTTDLKPVDTTGAGDAFNGALAVALAEKMPLETALQFANSAASISVTRKGTAPAMALRTETEALLSDFYGVNL